MNISLVKCRFLWFCWLQIKMFCCHFRINTLTCRKYKPIFQFFNDYFYHIDRHKAIRRQWKLHEVFHHPNLPGLRWQTWFRCSLRANMESGGFQAHSATKMTSYLRVGTRVFQKKKTEKERWSFWRRMKLLSITSARHYTHFVTLESWISE